MPIVRANAIYVTHHESVIHFYLWHLCPWWPLLSTYPGYLLIRYGLRKSRNRRQALARAVLFCLGLAIVVPNVLFVLLIILFAIGLHGATLPL